MRVAGFTHSNSNLSNSHSPSHSIQGILLLQNQHSCFPSPLASSMFSLVILTSPCPSLQTRMLFSKHAHHPSSTHACTMSLKSPLLSEPLFPSIKTSSLGPLSSFLSSVLHHTLLSPLLSLHPSQNCHFIFPQNTNYCILKGNQ